MVLVAAAVCTKSGKAIVSRQFVEMSKARIEGLLAAFPKLKDSGKQHTFVETDSVRYVYQPLDLLYMLLITTKASNILEDLETLRLFSKVVPEYCRSLDEADISSNAFSLIYAFDEIVALGYRESVNLAQIRTFVEMDSHEEKVYKAVRETQEREAKIKMKEKAKELQRKKYEESRGLSGRGSTAIYGSGGNSSGYPSTSSSTLSLQANDMKPRSQESRPVLPKASSKAMKLGSKSRDVDSFLGALQQEGETVSSAKVDAARKADAPTHSEPIHVLVHEELLVKAGRDGSLRSLEVQGILKLCINDPEYSLIRVQMENSDTRGIQFQTNPNVDRELWRSCSQIGMKQADKPFPAKTEIGVLRWRFKTSQGEHIPLAINCWPQEDGSGGCDVNIEYTLEQTELELRDVSIQVPLMAGAPPPQVSTCDGEHKHDRAHGCLVWSIPLLDASNPSGSLEFSARGGADIFFPVKVAFSSTTSFCSLKVGSIVSADDSKPQPYSVDYELATTDYQID